MTAVDTLVLFPVIPALPIIITWWLPWEMWLRDKVPKIILGPYLCYLAFAAWYFRLHWWAVLGLAVWALIVFSLPVKKKVHGKQNEEP